MPTIKEIAQEAGVSTATVSNILNGKFHKVSDETRERVLDVVQKRGYKPNLIAQGLRSRSTKTIGIIAEDIAQFTTPEIAEGVMEICEEQGYRTVIQNLRLYQRWGGAWFDREALVDQVLRPAIQEFSEMMVDGIIYIAGHARTIPMPEEMRIPMVIVYAYPKDPTVPAIVIDDEKSAYDVTTYLIGQGHRKIALIAGSADNLHTKLRLRGYQKALFENSILYDPDLVVSGEWDREDAYRVSPKVIESGATAVFCMNDRMAGGFYRYCYEHKIRIGEDISVVGHDNEMVSEYYCPELTTMEIPLREIGRKAMNVFLHYSEIAPEEKLDRVSCVLRERASVRKI
ncbi:LacI family transcriptional regulator [Lachnospiraceae bacterium NK3A20]|nr:LacI family transcriptional regulator [Lachnospiraceae bacterium NK3A20]